MSDLYLSLMAVGAVFITLVVIYNWWQERKYKQRASAAFASYQQDVLLDPAMVPMQDSLAPPEDPEADLDDAPFDPALYRPTAFGLDRAEPSLHAHKAEPDTKHDEPNFHSPVTPAPKTARDVLTFPSQQDDKVDVIAVLTSRIPLDVDLIRSAYRQLSRLEKRVSWQVQVENQDWFPLDLDTTVDMFALRVGLQLADRRGPLDEPALRQFLSVLETFAEEADCTLSVPPASQILADAAKLDSFCADVDLTIGLNLIPTGRAFVVAELRTALEKAGLRLMADGAFHRVSDKGQHWFSVANLDATPFALHPGPRDLSTGITLLFDVPRVQDGLQTFLTMNELANQLAGELNGKLVDDNRKALSDGGLASIRQQLRAIYGTMHLRGIEPGTPTALRLFA